MWFSRRVKLYFLFGLLSGGGGFLLLRVPVFERQELICGFLLGVGAVLLLHGLCSLLGTIRSFLIHLLFIGETLCDLDADNEDDNTAQ